MAEEAGGDGEEEEGAGGLIASPPVLDDGDGEASVAIRWILEEVVEVNGDEMGFRDVSGAEKSEGVGRSDLQSKTRLIFDFLFLFLGYKVDSFSIFFWFPKFSVKFDWVHRIPRDLVYA